MIPIDFPTIPRCRIHDCIVDQFDGCPYCPENEDHT